MSLSVPAYSRLRAILVQAKLQSTNNAEFQFLSSLLDYIKTFSDDTADAINNNGLAQLLLQEFLTASDPLPQLTY